MPPETILQMRRVAEEKARFQNEHMARNAAPLRDTILLGKSKIPVPKTLLRGYGLRRLGSILYLDSSSLERKNYGSSENHLALRKGFSIRPSWSSCQELDQPCSEMKMKPPAKSTVELDADTQRLLKTTCPIRTFLGHSPIQQCSNDLGPTPRLGSTRNTPRDCDQEDPIMLTRTSLVPVSPRSPRRPWSSPRDNTKGQRMMTPVLRSSLVSCASPRPTTAHGRSPRKCAVSCQEKSECHDPVAMAKSSPPISVPPLKLNCNK